MMSPNEPDTKESNDFGLGNKSAKTILLTRFLTSLETRKSFGKSCEHTVSS